jgi:2-polyprenyl-3-methyl-5-hydroxy-6-metoxy-1,4-benzoquinol methylase
MKISQVLIVFTCRLWHRIRAHAPGRTCARYTSLPTMAVRIDPHHREGDALSRLGVTFAGARVLEIGCGDGRLTRTYAQRARAVVAIDPDQNAIAGIRADSTWPDHVQFLPVGIDAFPPTAARFDIVLFAWSL